MPQSPGGTRGDGRLLGPDSQHWAYPPRGRLELGLRRGERSYRIFLVPHRLTEGRAPAGGGAGRGPRGIRTSARQRTERRRGRGRGKRLRSDLCRHTCRPASLLSWTPFWCSRTPVSSKLAVGPGRPRERSPPDSPPATSWPSTGLPPSSPLALAPLMDGTPRLVSRCCGASPRRPRRTPGSSSTAEIRFVSYPFPDPEPTSPSRLDQHRRDSPIRDAE